jgi:SpoIVB peptidase S55
MNVRQSASCSAIRIVPVFLLFCLAAALPSSAQEFFPLSQVRPGLHGIGRTVFQGNRIEEFQVEILGVLENLTPRHTIILGRLSGGPLADMGVLQGMSGSPIYIDGKLLGAVALGFPFSKQPLAGITPIEEMLADANFSSPANRIGPIAANPQSGPRASVAGVAPAPAFASSFGNLTEISTPVALSGFTARTLQTFAADFRRLGFEPLQGVSAGNPASPQYTGSVAPGSMISVELLTGDMVISADGTVTHVDGKRVYAFGHRFLETGTTELPFARSDVVALLPALTTSSKLSAAREWVGTIVSDRNSTIAGEIGRPAHMIPLSVTVQSPQTGIHNYHFQVVNDRLLTPFITQAAIFSTIDVTERTIGPGTLRLRGRIEFEGDRPPLIVQDIFVGDNAVAQQGSADAVVTLGFVLGSGFKDLRVKHITYTLDSIESKRQLRIAQVWASVHELRPGDPIEITALLQGENGLEVTRSATFKVPAGAPIGPLNVTVSDAMTMNAPEFAGLTQSALRTPEELIRVVNHFRGSGAAYVRIWRQEPSFTISGPLPGGDITDPPPSVMLVLADPSASASSNAALTLTRGSQIAELTMPVDDYVVTGSKTIQVEIKP